MRLIGLAVCLVLGCALVPLAAETQQAWDRQAVYAAREAQLKQAIESRPADPQPLVDLAAFYLKPVAPRDVEAADGVRRRVMVPLRNEWIVEGITPKTSWRLTRRSWIAGPAPTPRRWPSKPRTMGPRR
jgi:hypothetical protein